MFHLEARQLCIKQGAKYHFFSRYFQCCSCGDWISFGVLNESAHLFFLFLPSVELNVVQKTHVFVTSSADCYEKRGWSQDLQFMGGEYDTESNSVNLPRRDLQWVEPRILKKSNYFCTSAIFDVVYQLDKLLRLFFTPQIVFLHSRVGRLSS